MLLLPALGGALSLALLSRGLWTFGAWLLFGALLLDRGRHVKVALPFALGLLLWPLKLTAWDRWEFATRVHLLLVLATLLALGLLLLKYRVLPRLLDRFEHLGFWKRLLMVGLLGQMLLLIPALVVSQNPGVTVGDEPYYLVVGQSLARDGDLNIFNQHYRGTFRSIVTHKELPPHGTFGRGEKRLFSTHLPGMPLTLVPFLKKDWRRPQDLHRAVRIWLSFFGALLGVLLWYLGERLLGSPRQALLLTLFGLATCPLFMMSVHLFPEIQATVLVLLALALLAFRPTGPGTFVAGLLLGGVVFWGVKYLVLAGLYGLGFLLFLLIRGQRRRGLFLALGALGPLALFLFYLHDAYGSFSINAVYFGVQSGPRARALAALVHSIPHSLRLKTLAAYFLDQRDGLWPYNLFLLLALPGFLRTAVRTRGRDPLVLLSLPPLAYLLYHAATTFRAGDCPQGRFLVPLVPFMLYFAHQTFRWLWTHGNRLVAASFVLMPLTVSLLQLLSPQTLYQTATHEYLQPGGLLFQQMRTFWLFPDHWLPALISRADSQPGPVFWGVLAGILLLTLTLACRRVLAVRLLGAVPGLFALLILGARLLTPAVPLYGAAWTTEGGHLLRMGTVPPQSHPRSAPVDGAGTVTLMAGRPLSHLDLSLRAGGGDRSVKVFLFDRVAEEPSLRNGETRTFRLNPDTWRRVGHRFFLRLTVVPGAGEGRVRVVDLR